jgi:formylglycine-generating enzyme required for sulfatase activity
MSKSCWKILLLVGWIALAICPTVYSQDAEEPAVNGFEIPAWAYDRGNLKTFTTNYASGGPMVANGGVFPNTVEFDIPFPVDAVYTMSIKYAANDVRPLTMSIDGEEVGTVCPSKFSGWDSAQAQWEVQRDIEFTAGVHTIKLTQATAYPHLCALKFETEMPFPEGWELDRPKAKTLNQAVNTTGGMTAGPVKVDEEALRRAIDYLDYNYQEQYDGETFLTKLDMLLIARDALLDQDSPDEEEQQAVEDALRDLQREALFHANPLIDFEQLLVLKRSNGSPSQGLTKNWQSNSSLPRSGFDDELVLLPMDDLEADLESVYKPENPYFVGDVDMNWDADKMLFSSIGTDNRWQVFEINIDGTGLRQLTGEQSDVDNYDACYLPSGDIIFTSTGSFTGVPCVYGSSHVATIYRMDADGRDIRQLSFDQEHNWCPAVLNNGRVLYQRWEYSGLPHSNSRMLFHCNPDGTNQTEYYGSGSYWPNSIFYARAVPGHSSQIAAIIGGHHDNPRMGELYIIDPALGRREADGVVQQIPGYGIKKEPIIADGLTKNSWPKFLHPYPLNDKFLIVSCKPSPQSQWGVYLVDVFDNLVLLREEETHVLFEPIPLRETERPPVIPERVDLDSDEATVYIADIYNGPGLAGVPRGAVKNLRIITYHFSYQNMGGLLGIVGVDGPWDIKQVLGTVPVNPDGSTKFTIPASTPVAFQPLDADGRALQLMRSWTTGMPGETLQCNGCHEPQNTAAARGMTTALVATPFEIEPWYGPRRGFSYAREVQPIIDRYCVGCHDGNSLTPGGTQLVSLSGSEFVENYHSISPGQGTNHVQKDSHFSVGYFELQRYCRRPGIESDTHMLTPMDFHAGSTELVQILEKGHYGVELSDEAWDRINTWIDLNCPFHGTWREATRDPGVQRTRRIELASLYGGVDTPDPEAIYPTTIETGPFIVPELSAYLANPLPTIPEIPNWPLSAEAAAALQGDTETSRTEIELADGITLPLVRIPAGNFIMGSQPVSVGSYWIGSLEITNEQFQLFDPFHDSRVESKHSYQFGVHGYPLNLPEQPVVRVDWNKANAFCRWLSQETGMKFSLPTEDQWEYAARAGTATPFWYGDVDADFGTYANVADARLTGFVTNPYTVDTELANPPHFDDWIPKDSRFNDGQVLVAAPGSYAANPWGLYDVHGNVAEWTRSDYAPALSDSIYADPGTDKVVRGGSWYDRPYRCTSSYRLRYAPYHAMFNVGFRVVCEE